MKSQMRIVVTSIAAALIAFATSSHAQSFPARPMKLVVPFAAGGPVDAVARILGQRMGDRLGQQIVVENRTGAGGNIGTESVVRAPADGYTLLWGVMSSITVNPSLYRKLPYSTVNDLVPVVLAAQVQNMLLVHPALPARTVAELVAYAKANPGKLTYASAGVGSSAYLAAELLKNVAGIDVVHVPYKGTSQAYPDLLGGQLSMMFDAPYVAAPRVKAGELRALAVADAQRSTALPEVPTMAEAGAPGVLASSWYGLMAPAGTSRAIVTRLNAEANLVLKDAETLARLAAIGAQPLGGTPEAFADHIRSEIEKWARVVKQTGVTVE